MARECRAWKPAGGFMKERERADRASGAKVVDHVFLAWSRKVNIN